MSSLCMAVEQRANAGAVVDMAGEEAGSSQDTEDLVCYAQVLEYLVGCCEPTVVVELSSEMT